MMDVRHLWHKLHVLIYAFKIAVIPESLDRGFNSTEFEFYTKRNLIGIYLPLFPDKEEDTFQAINNFYAPFPFIEDLDLNREAFNTVRYITISYLLSYFQLNIIENERGQIYQYNRAFRILTNKRRNTLQTGTY